MVCWYGASKKRICLENLRQKHSDGEHGRSFAGAAYATSSCLLVFIDIFVGYTLACCLDIPLLDCMCYLLVLQDTQSVFDCYVAVCLLSFVLFDTFTHSCGVKVLT